MKYLFETERLGFRNWEIKDIAKFAKINADEKVMQYFPKCLTYEETVNSVKNINFHFEKWGYGLWVVEEKKKKDFIGFIGLNHTDFKTSFSPCVEIGWRLDQKFWGLGYASEGAKLCLKKAFSDFGLKQIYSFTSVLNLKSENVMIKLGMQKFSEFEHPKLENSNPLCRHVAYTIS